MVVSIAGRAYIGREVSVGDNVAFSLNGHLKETCKER